jgi:L-lysine 6-transaminase
LDGNISNDIDASESQSKNDLDAAFSKHGEKVAGIIVEPMQGEGGDNHFRSEFLQMLRDYSDKHDCLLIFDEIQTGFWGSGKPWMWQHHGVAPDVASFGKKTQICGIYANDRVKEVEDNVFSMSSRINSTWGGNLVDMVRSKRFIEIILKENLGHNVLKRGAEFVDGLRAIAKEKGTFSNIRGVGSLSAFTLDTAEARDAIIGRMMQNKLLALKSGPRSIRFRMPLVISRDEVSEVLRRVESSL